MKSTVFVILFLLQLLFFYDNSAKNQYLDSINISRTKAISFDSIPPFDTSITLLKQPFSNYKGINLTDSLARRVLYKHFKNKGFLIRDEMRGDFSEENETRNCVRFSRLYKVDLNKNSFSDAIIEYWSSPLYVSGKCWQPHKAVIIDTDVGYIISNEEFIPSNFDIDSIAVLNGFPVLYGIDYNCKEDKVKRYFTLTLK